MVVWGMSWASLRMSASSSLLKNLARAKEW
jgi:hypothetical protein